MFIMATSKTWTGSLDQDPEKPGLWKTYTLKKLDPEKPGLWKTWTLKSMNPEKHGINMGKIMSLGSYVR